MLEHKNEGKVLVIITYHVVIFWMFRTFITTKQLLLIEIKQ